MSILTLFVALLLSGSSSVPVHTHGVFGGGPISGSQAATTTSTPSPDGVIGGGPTT